MAKVMILQDNAHVEVDEEILEKRVGESEDDQAKYRWVEYYLNGEQVHRSAWVDLKLPVISESAVNGFV